MQLSRVPYADLTAELTPCPESRAAVELDLTTRGPSSVERRVERRLLRPGDSWIIGSRAPADLCLPDAAVSRRHCRLEHLGHELEVSDLESRNGVFVGGARVVRARLSLEGSFNVGRTTIALAPQRPHTDELLPGMVGGSRVMVALAQFVRRCAQVRVPILIRGESGSGKELVARGLHLLGPRAKGAFVALNAATLSPGLAESELFGHRRGAFTGAEGERLGAFRSAHGGTLFLDELGALSPALQAKLLRVVEEGSVMPLGGDRAESCDVRIVTASCEPLEERVASGEFRADLYERLATCVVRVPALRDRPEDIGPLATHLVRGFELGPCALGEGVVRRLASHDWPGNVRELRNVLVQAALEAPGLVISHAAVHAVLEQRERLRAASTGSSRRKLTVEHALALVSEAKGNVSEAARRSRVPRSTLRDHLRRAQNSPTRPSPPSEGEMTGTTPNDGAGGLSLGAVSTK